MDILAYTLAKNKAKEYTDTVVDPLKTGMKYKGSCLFEDLPEAVASKKGWVYTVTDKNNHEYVCDGTQWIDLGSELDTISTVLNGHVTNTTIHVTTSEKNTWNAKQDALPTVTANRYLHTNSTTGALEWSSVNIPTPTYVTSTLDADNWSNSTYSFEGVYPFANYDIEVSLAPTATESERDAYAEGMMTGSPNSNVITALGTVPTDDIPVFIKVRSK